MSLVLAKYGARISAASSDQSIRGIKFGAYRPDTIIADDVEDMASVQTQESRNRVFNWFVSEVIPAGDQNTKIVNIGNLLHEDSLLMRLKDSIESGQLKGVYREYPIVDDNGDPLWAGKYPTPESLAEQKQKVIDERAWLREFCLKIVPDQGQIILPEWIKFYTSLPAQDEANDYLGTFVGVDLAISEKQASDCTAVVAIHVYGSSTANRRYFISPNFVNERLTFLVSKTRIEQFCAAIASSGRTLALIEDNMYQGAMVELLKESGVDVKGLRSQTSKRTRLITASMLFEQGKVFFPENGACKLIITQILGLGTEKHDDLCDATTIALNYINTKVKQTVLMASLLGDDSDIIYGMSYGD